MNGAARVLRGDVAQDLHLSGLGVDLHVAKLGGEARPLAVRVDGGSRYDRPAGRGALGRDILERKRRELAGPLARGPGESVLPDHILDIDLPDLCGPCAHFSDHLIACADHGAAGRVGYARAAGGLRVADRIGVGDDWPHPFVFDPQRLGRHLGRRSARAADIRAAGRDDRRAVFVDVHGRARFAAAVEPVAHGHAATLVLPERFGVARMPLQRLQGFGKAFMRNFRAVDQLRSRFGDVLQPELQGVHADLLRRRVHGALHGVCGDRRTGSAVGDRLRAIAHHVVADGAHVRNVVRREAAHQAVHDR